MSDFLTLARFSGETVFWHGSKRGLRVESPMAGDELTCWAGTKNQTFKVKYCESDTVSTRFRQIELKLYHFRSISL